MQSMNESVKKRKRNPFQFGVVVDDSAFCNRKKEIAFLKRQIDNNYSTWIFSPRRFGKTSLVEKVFRETASAKCIYIDLYNIQSLDDFARKYTRILGKDLFDWKEDIRKLTHNLAAQFKNLSPVVSFDDSGNPGFSLNVGKIEQQSDIETILGVPERIAARKNEKVCIAFDEFQEISRIDPFLLNWMRSSFQRQQNVCYVFLGSKQSMMEDIFASSRSPFYEFAVKFDLQPIAKEELSLFIQEKFRLHQLPISQKTTREILTISEGQPHYTQFFASLVFEMVRNGHDQDSEEFQRLWLNRVIQSQSDIFQDIYDQLTNSQRLTLIALAATRGEGIYSEEVRDRFQLPASSTITEALTALQKKALIYKSKNHYVFTNPVLREWVKVL